MVVVNIVGGGGGVVGIVMLLLVVLQCCTLSSLLSGYPASSIIFSFSRKRWKISLLKDTQMIEHVQQTDAHTHTCSRAEMSQEKLTANTP